MKKLMTMIALLITVSAQAQDKTAVEKAAATVSNAVDSTKAAVKETVHLVDTSSNFRKIYTDVTSGITALASGLKVGAEHVYGVLVKQQIVVAITDTIWILIWITCIAVCWSNLKKGNIDNDGEPDGRAWLGIAFGIVSIVLLIIIALTGMIPEAVMGYCNPEYGAIEQIIKMVK